MPVDKIIGMINQGLNTVGTAGAIMGIGQRKQDERQIRQQGKLNSQQIAGQKALAEHQKQMQLDMWDKTNYPAQVKQLKEAGLNPALLYGHSGGGGTTVGSGTATSVTGGQAANSAATQQANTGLIMSLAQQKMMQSQIALNESQAEKNKAEADKISGVDTELGQAQVANLTQGIENAKQAQLLTQVQTRLAQIQEQEMGSTLEDRIDRVEYETRKASAEMEQALNEAYVTSNVREEKIKIFQQEAIQGVLKNILTEANTKLTNTQSQSLKSAIEVNKAQINKMAQEIQMGWESLSQGDTKNAIEKFKGEVTANYPSLFNVIGRGIDDTIELIFGTKGGRPQYKAVPQK